MCWESRSFNPQIAEKDIPIFKICRIDQIGPDFVEAIFFRRHYKLGKVYYSNDCPFSPIEGTGEYTFLVYKAFHSYHPDMDLIIKNVSEGIFCFERHLNLYYNNNYTFRYTALNNRVIVEGYIPKGTRYCLNEYGEYISDSICLEKASDIDEFLTKKKSIRLDKTIVIFT